MEYTTLFDISQKGYDWFPAILCPIFILVGIVQLRNKAIGKAIRYHPVLPIVIGLTFGLISMWAQYDERQYYELLLAKNQTFIAEGPVKNFQTWPKGDHGKETFTVEGIRFAYNGSITAAFNTTQAYGGPMHEGLYVRIHYVVSRGSDEELAILLIETKK